MRWTLHLMWPYKLPCALQLSSHKLPCAVQLLSPLICIVTSLQTCIIHEMAREPVVHKKLQSWVILAGRREQSKSSQRMALLLLCVASVLLKKAGAGLAVAI